MEKIYAVILAAGTSSRLGFNKLTLKINGQSVIEMAAEPFFQKGIEKIHVVTNPENGPVKKALETPFIFPLQPSAFSLQPFTFIPNPHFQEGMSSSIKAVTPFIQDADAVFFQLGDKPFIKKEMVEQMIELYVSREKNLFDIIVPVYRGKKGHPVLMNIKPYIKEIQNLEGDKGLREIIDNHSGSVLFIEGDEGNIFDIDTEGEIHTLRERGYVIEKD
ncbi:MAG: nucleotidyltransferase family protein [Proteobacteria bacterium]|nr:nucleotidyltransferase family protein [Pseudomonadota bacterium]